jgi:hypothetical protein
MITDEGHLAVAEVTVLFASVGALEWGLIGLFNSNRVDTIFRIGRRSWLAPDSAPVALPGELVTPAAQARCDGRRASRPLALNR